MLPSLQGRGALGGCRATRRRRENGGPPMPLAAAPGLAATDGHRGSGPAPSSRNGGRQGHATPRPALSLRFPPRSAPAPGRRRLRSALRRSRPAPHRRRGPAWPRRRPRPAARPWRVGPFPHPGRSWPGHGWQSVQRGSAHARLPQTSSQRHPRPTGMLMQPWTWCGSSLGVTICMTSPSGAGAGIVTPPCGARKPGFAP